MEKIGISPGLSEAERGQIDKLAQLFNENWHEDGEDTTAVVYPRLEG